MTRGINRCMRCGLYAKWDDLFSFKLQGWLTDGSVSEWEHRTGTGCKRPPTTT